MPFCLQINIYTPADKREYLRKKYHTTREKNPNTLNTIFTFKKSLRVEHLGTSPWKSIQGASIHIKHEIMGSVRLYADSSIPLVVSKR